MISHLKRLALLVVTLTLVENTKAQNLVPNPSFELRNTCPSSFSTIPYSPNYNLFPFIQSWVSPTDGTPDYMHLCAGFGSPVHVPNNIFGYQAPHSGDAYAGMFFWLSGSNYREYLQTRLVTPMQAGEQYYMSMYYSPTIGESGPNFDVVGISNIGMHITSNHITQVTGAISLTPQITQPSGQNLVDTSSWIKIKGIYASNGGEEWLTIGNFDANPNIPHTVIIDNPGTLFSSYSYLDDINVTKIKHTIVNKRDTIVCAGNYPLVLPSLQRPADIFLWNTSANTPNISVSNAGVYWRKAWNDSTIFVDTIHVIEDNLVTTKPDLGPDISMCGNEITLATVGNYTQYNWNTGASSPSIIVNQNGQYILNVSTCGDTKSDTINVELFPLPVPPITNNISVCKENGVILSATGQDLLWYNSLTANGSSAIPVVNTSEAGMQTFYVTQTVNGCTSNKSPIVVTITSENCAGCLIIPNAFTPNADGINDKFEVLTKCPLRKFQLSIYNRFGELVFTSTDSKAYWDGRHKGQFASDIGTYYFQLKYIIDTPNTKEEVTKGDITLLR